MKTRNFRATRATRAARQWVLASTVVATLAAPVLAGAQSTDPGAEPARVQVSAFEVSGNTLLSPALVDAVLQPFKGLRTLPELEAAAAAVQRLYAQQGYGGVVAFVPPQTPTSGQVQITVIEGRVGRVEVNGAERSGEANVRASLPDLAAGTTPRLRRIDAQLQIANENPAKRTEVLLQPGAEPGQVDAVVTVRETPVQRWSVTADNSGSSGTGRLRLGLGWQHANLSGHDDVLSAQVVTAPQNPSRVKVLSAGYRVPLYRWLTVLDAYAAYSDVDGGNTPTAVGDLSFNGRGRLYGVRASHHLSRWGEVDRRLVAGLDRRDYLNQCAIAGLPAGACGPAGESVTVQPVSLEYVLRSGGAVAWGLGAGLHHNPRWGGARTDAASFEAVRPGAEPRYTALRVNGFAGAPVFEEWTLQARMALQWTDDALVPAEQFGIGGANTVRGFDERELTGDRGVFASVELLTPAWGGDAVPGLQLLVFADAGRVTALRGAQCLPGSSSCGLASAGVGARAGTADTQLRLNVGHALRDGARTQKNKTRVHAAFSHRF
jgi:hemolysin activation/secretion protein